MPRHSSTSSGHTSLLVWPTTTSPIRRVDQESAATFAELVFDPSRLKTLVLLSTSRRHGDQPLLDPTALYEQVGEHVDIAVLADDAATQTLKELLPLTAWGGAARIYRPDARKDDPKHHHPLVTITADNQAAAIRAILDRLHGLGVAYTTTTPEPSEGTPPQGGKPDTAPAPAATHQWLTGEVERLHSELTDKDRTLKDREETLSKLRREVRRLSKQLRTAEERAAVDLPAVYADPERQFRYEVEQHWLRAVPEPERPDYPLGDYALGSEWLDSIMAMKLVDRRKIVEVAVDVLTGRAADNPGRQVHRMRARDERGARHLVRADQAIGMRCYIKNGSASAPRLMWWKLPDHTIELGRVATHDDTQLR
ncbi:hypothetical protein [Streptomyces sp. NPDC058268]|uniref:hypothetical protein n=1 Tax=Streptomyces sp. NPDC058268 TaxID=3346413 RepID=UPI0036EB03C9